MGKVSGSDSGNLELLAKIKELEEKNAELKTKLEGKISNVKAFNYTSENTYSVSANGEVSIIVDIDTIRENGYTLVSYDPMTFFCTNSAVILARSRVPNNPPTASTREFVFRNISSTAKDNIGFYGKWLGFKK